jgi:hypothetical protein
MKTYEICFHACSSNEQLGIAVRPVEGSTERITVLLLSVSLLSPYNQRLLLCLDRQIIGLLSTSLLGCLEHLPYSPSTSTQQLPLISRGHRDYGKRARLLNSDIKNDLHAIAVDARDRNFYGYKENYETVEALTSILHEVASILRRELVKNGTLGRWD